MSGRAYLVGAGPGDPGLITVRGRELLASAEVVMHDRLGTAELLPLAAADAEIVDVGKAPGDVAMTQEQINAYLCDAVRAGRRVVRLKGGDPFVFGRGGEEAIALAAAGLDFEIVPGITSAIAAPAYAGIPVTHRAVATSVTIVTGHEDPAKPETQTDWAALARVPGTLVLLMSVRRWETIAAALIAAGRDPAEPAAAVRWGTTSAQQTVSADLAGLGAAMKAAGIGAPAVIVVGGVAGDEVRREWFSGPLLGRRVVVTRARAQAGELSQRLRALGAEVIELPTIRIRPVDSAEISAACADIGRYRMLVLTSVNGVDCLFDRLRESGRDARALHPECEVIAIGPATAERLAARGIHADLVPERYVAEGILDALVGRDLAELPVLVARAAEARPDLVDGLRERGAAVDEVLLYATEVEDPPRGRVEAALDADIITFTASSTVRNFAGLLTPLEIDRLAARVVSIGPITSATARDVGLTVSAEASPHTIPALVEAVLADAAGD